MKKNILLVNDEMQMGGVARIVNTLLKYIDKDKYNIDLLVLHSHGKLLQEVPKEINIISGTSFFSVIDKPIAQCKGLDLFKKIRLVMYMKFGLIQSKIKKERKKILNKTYDIEFSCKEGFCTIFVANGDSKKKINWVQVDYKQSNYSKNHMSLMINTLKNIDLNIACSNTVKDSYQELFHTNKIEVIHNLIDTEKIINLSNQKFVNFNIDENKINLITVARFHPQKSLDRLIKAYAKFKDYYTLTIIGDGELKDELINLSKNLNVYDDINWLGLKTNPYNYIKACDLFVMSSLYEGYPTVTLESLISTTPVLSTLVAGILEQITSDHHGFIVENSLDGLLFKLDELKDKKDLLKDYKNKLSNYKYENQDILNKYYLIFDN